MFEQEHAKRRPVWSGVQQQQRAKGRKKRLENQPGFWKLPSLSLAYPSHSVLYHQEWQGYLLLQQLSFISWKEAAGRLAVEVPWCQTLPTWVFWEN